MPYSSVSDVPDYVPKANRKQWLEVFNSAYARATKDGKSAKEAEESAFAQANAVAGPNAKAVKVHFDPDRRRGWMVLVTGDVVKAAGTAATGFVRAIDGPFRCGHCDHMEKEAGAAGVCIQPEVNDDPELKDEPRNDDGLLLVAGGDCCNEYDPVGEVSAEKSARSGGAMKYRKFIPFAKVDEAKKQVWGIVTAELPDKDDEVCDYVKTKPYYEKVIAEISKATDGKNFFPLREMHQLTAAGKCVGFEFRDGEREIFMGFEVVEPIAWEKVQKGVYTGFSQGGRIVGELVPDDVYKGCMRYVADPSEISLVDNPCLGAAHFAYIKADATIELRKLRSVPAVASDRVPDLVRLEVAKALASSASRVRKAKTKRVAGEDLPASAFLIVGDPEKTATWKLPIKFSSEAKTKRHIRNALSRFSSLKGVSQADKDKAWKRLVAAAKEHDIDVTEEKAKLTAIRDYLRKCARRSANQLTSTRGMAKVSTSVCMLDIDLGRLAKGMYEVSRLAVYIEELGYLLYQVVSEQEWEDDEDSVLPELLAGNVSDLIDSLVHMVDEEGGELKEQIAARAEV